MDCDVPGILLFLYCLLTYLEHIEQLQICSSCVIKLNRFKSLNSHCKRVNQKQNKIKDKIIFILIKAKL